MPIGWYSIGNQQDLARREIRRRRNELVTEMYSLLKRKDELGNIMKIEDHDEGLEAYVNEQDIINQ